MSTEAPASRAPLSFFRSPLPAASITKATLSALSHSIFCAFFLVSTLEGIEVFCAFDALAGFFRAFSRALPAADTGHAAVYRSSARSRHLGATPHSMCMSMWADLGLKR